MARLYKGNNLISNLIINKNLDLNIHVGNTAPADTSKLWIDCSEPNSYEVLDRTQSGESGEWSKNTSSDGRTAYTEKYGSSGSIGVYVGNKAYSLTYGNSEKLYSIWELDLTSNTSEWTQVVADTSYRSTSYNSRFSLFEYNGLLHYFESFRDGSLSTYYIRLKRMNSDYSLTNLAAFSYTYGYVEKTIVIGDYAFIFTDGSYVRKFDLINYGNPVAVGSLTFGYYRGYAVQGTNIFCFGGYATTYLNTIIKIDTLENTITTLDTVLPTAANGINTAVIDNEIYLIGGDTSTVYTTFNTNLSTMYKFNTTNNTLTEITLNTPLAVAANIARYNTETCNIEFFGGYEANSNNYYRYSLPMVVNLESGKLQILTDATAIECEIIKSDNSSFKQGISKVQLGNSQGHAEAVTAYVYNTSTSTWDLI